MSYVSPCGDPTAFVAHERKFLRAGGIRVRRDRQDHLVEWLCKAIGNRYYDRCHTTTFIQRRINGLLTIVVAFGRPILGVETAVPATRQIREDASSISKQSPVLSDFPGCGIVFFSNPYAIIVAATVQSELSDLTSDVIDVAGGEKTRKRRTRITRPTSPHQQEPDLGSSSALSRMMAATRRRCEANARCMTDLNAPKRPGGGSSVHRKRGCCL